MAWRDTEEPYQETATLGIILKQTNEQTASFIYLCCYFIQKVNQNILSKKIDR